MRVSIVIAVLLFASLGCSSATHKVDRPSIITAQAWGSVPQAIPDSRKHTPAYITIHHAGVEWKGGDAKTFVKNMQSWGQKEKNWPDLPYHFLIAPDGTIYEGRPLRYEPESNTKYALQGNIGVEMMGNFEIQRPSPQQLISCVRLVAWLSQDLHIPTDKIRGHKDAAPNQTSCPGKDFYRYLESGQFVKWVKAVQAGDNSDIKPGEALKDGPTTQISTQSVAASNRSQ